MGMTPKVNHSRFDFNLMFLTRGIFTTEGTKKYIYINIIVIIIIIKNQTRVRHGAVEIQVYFRLLETDQWQ